nr:uncharacterized protein LOC124220309 isoform X2 [Neodiprion pinetum]
MASPGRNHAVTDLSRINRLVILMTTCCFLSDLANAKMHQILRHKLAPIDFSRGDVSLSTPMECLRPCRENEPPKICYYHFTLEIYSAQGLACSLCTPNMTNDLDHTCQCVTADGVERTLLAVNRMLPGPSIQVCQGDKIVVDVENLMQGMETTIHWHGIYQTGTPYQDGVPFVTQCPIATGLTHRYQFMATNQGTHFWHSHDALQKMDGLYGSLVIREPPQSDPNSHLYDYDTPSTVMVISDWLHREATEHYPGLLDTPGQIAEAVLIHGRGQWMNQTSKVTTTSPLAVYTVKQGKRYRFRMINAFCTVCPAELSFQNHDMTVIASDGEHLQPVSASVLTSYAGERYDFIIDASQAVGTYWIRVRAVGECSGPAVQQYGILRYEGGPHLPTSEQPLYSQSFAQGLILNSASSNVCSTSTQPIDGNLCASGFRSALPIVIDVENLMQGMETSIHWHGIYQTGTPYQDGVPFVTQCPIATGLTHRYQFMATNQGTHFWHSHDALQKMDGIYGSLVIREPPESDPNSHLYDYDTPPTVMVISDWLHREATEHYPGLLDTPGQAAEAVLIHGRGQWMNQTSNVTTTSPLAVYTVKQGKRYRFRMINAFCTVCPAELSFQNHDMTVIASDGEHLQPVSASVLTSYAGERYDFIIDASQSVGTYWIRVRAIGECSGPAVQQYGILRYEGGPDLPTSEQPLYSQSFAQGLILNSASSNVCSTSTQPIDGNLCASGFRSALPVDKEILKSVPDFKFYLPSGFVTFPNTEIFTPNTYLQYFVPPQRVAVASVINNISFVSPPAPLISQRNDIPLELICNGENLPENGDGSYCACTHVLSVPLNAVVEIVFCDAAPQSGLSHPFHLHGNAFRIIGMGASADPSVTVLNATTIRDLDRRGLLVRNFDQPPAKDTAIIPSNGYLITRFLANNPGYWLYHCHFVFHSITGMEVVIQVGDVMDIPPVPQNFPTCGDYLPKI